MIRLQAARLAGFGGALFALVVAPLGNTSFAATIRYNSTSYSITQAWTNCPSNPGTATNCNYTIVYAATGSSFSRFVVLNLGNIRVYPGGGAEITAAAIGYSQPATTVTVNSALSNGTASAAMIVYAGCTDYTNPWTCAFSYNASISANTTATAASTSWRNSASFTTPTGYNYSNTTSGASRPTKGTATVRLNGSTWLLGRAVSGGHAQLTLAQSLSCPGACPRGSAAAKSSMLTPDKLLPSAPVKQDLQNFAVPTSEAEPLDLGTVNGLNEQLKSLQQPMNPPTQQGVH